jgi:hypothetical protein
MLLVSDEFVVCFLFYARSLSLSDCAKSILPARFPSSKSQTNMLVRFFKTDTYYVPRLRRVCIVLFDLCTNTPSVFQPFFYQIQRSIVYIQSKKKMNAKPTLMIQKSSRKIVPCKGFLLNDKKNINSYTYLLNV